MSEKKQNLESTEQNTNNSELSDAQRKIVIATIKILFILIIFLTGFIIEALINQHPVFEFLHYTIFKQDSVILGSIALNVVYLGFMVLGIALSNLILTSFKFNKTIYFLSLIGTSLIIASFIMLYRNYNWELGYQKYLSYFLSIMTATGQLILVTLNTFNNFKSSFYFYKIFKITLFIISILSIIFLAYSI